MIYIIIQKLIKIYNFTEYSVPVAFLRHIHERYLSLKYANDE